MKQFPRLIQYTPSTLLPQLSLSLRWERAAVSWREDILDLLSFDLVDISGASIRKGSLCNLSVKMSHPHSLTFSGQTMQMQIKSKDAVDRVKINYFQNSPPKNKTKQKTHLLAATGLFPHFLVAPFHTHHHFFGRSGNCAICLWKWMFTKKSSTVCLFIWWISVQREAKIWHQA